MDLTQCVNKYGRRSWRCQMAMKNRLDSISDEDLIAALPHGSGIDCEWTITRCKNGTIKCSHSFHAMNEVGYCCGYHDFTVHVFAHRKQILQSLIYKGRRPDGVVNDIGDVDVRISSLIKDRGSTAGLMDCLNDLVYESLTDAHIITL